MTLLSIALRGLIRGYQWFLSPILPGVCRFYPTCSEYAAEAIARRGPARGGWLTLKRFARCHPWGGSGYDPVPGSDGGTPSCAHPEHQHGPASVR